MNVKHVKAKKTFKFSEISPGNCFYRKDNCSVLMKLNNIQPNAVNIKNGILCTIIDTEEVIKVNAEMHIIQ